MWLTMWLVTVPGIVSIVGGLAFLFEPRSLSRARPRTAPSMVWIEVDEALLKHRVSSGICLVVTGVFCLLSAFYVWLRLH